MSLYQNPNDDLSAMISAALGVTVTSAQYSVLGIRPTTSADLPVSGGKNTKIAIQMLTGAAYRGQVNLYYDRLDLSQLANFSPVLLPAAVGAAASTLLTTLVNMYGFTFTAADLVNNVVGVAPDGVHLQLLLQATPGSLGFINSCEVLFTGVLPLSVAFYSTTLLGF